MRVKISAVAYLNAAPFIYGLQHSPFIESVELSLDVPAVGAQKLLSGQADIALTPVAAIPQSSDFKIVTDYCIGAASEVASVAVFAREPLEQLHTIYLDAHSRTSVVLVQLLASEHWRISPRFKMLERYEDTEKVEGGVGYLLIGDKTFAARRRFTCIYDLAQAWIAYTGKPFVFAAWVAKKEVPAATVAALNEALQLGVGHIDEVCGEAQARYPDVDVAAYLTNNISYPLDGAKREGMELFVEKLKRYLGER
ncbi:MAG: menaquinone biosynthesis protein [Prevotellaceae bacterium]|jgi:chorismate dehydratase|nr:menaquinone biosynthesis protein [Prevotellaceae bacterium]